MVYNGFRCILHCTWIMGVCIVLLCSLIYVGHGSVHFAATLGRVRTKVMGVFVLIPCLVLYVGRGNARLAFMFVCLVRQVLGEVENSSSRQPDFTKIS